MTPIASVKRDDDDEEEGTGKPGRHAQEEPEASEEPPVEDTPEDGG